MKLLILGASNAQLNAIRRAQVMNHFVIATDYYENSPGKQISDDSGLASTFDYEATLEIAKAKQVDGIMTTGTDQPVYTANKVASNLNLPHFLSVESAYSVTNKKAMKKVFIENNIPIVDYRIIAKNFNESELQGIKFPVVVKPLDSQGQRGIYKLYDTKEVREHFDKVIAYSREEEIMVESYYENDEITISGWVKNKEAKILTITDRVTFSNDENIGICTSHEFPSKHHKKYKDEFYNITNKIVDAFEINEGPIYFQLFVGKDGVKVNEIACRIGGAYEDEFIPLITGVDILKMVIDGSLGDTIEYEMLDNYHMEQNKNYCSVQLFFSREGKICDRTKKEDIICLPGVHNMDYNYKVGQVVYPLDNASRRAGYVIITSENKETLELNIGQVYESMKLLDDEGKNMIIRV